MNILPSADAGGQVRVCPDPPPPNNDGPLIAASDLPADILLPLLRGVSQSSAGQWSACCPAHHDSRPSLSVTECDDFRLLVHCHAGCDAEDVLAAVGLSYRHLFPSGYAAFKALSSGRRNPRHLDAVRPEGQGERVDVPDWHVDAMTSRARATYQAAGEHLPLLANKLLLPCQSLADFGVGVTWMSGRPVWVFPERDGKGRVVGLLYRSDRDGKKWSETDSRRGLIMAFRAPPAAANAPLYLPEGHTDTIALHAAGCLAIGRPAAPLNGPVEAWLAEFLLARPDLWQHRPVVATGDNDNAGIKGAEETATKFTKILGKSVVFDFPPPSCKDMRDWITSGLFKPGWPFISKE